MTLPSTSIDNVLKILLALSQYPILSKRIRHQMRKALFARGVITRTAFDEEGRAKAVESQGREGLHNPYVEEPADMWETRLQRVRDSLTDFYFAYNLPYSDFEVIVRQVLSEHGSTDSEFIWFNPELAPQDVVFEQAEMIESMPEQERPKYEARLQELIVVLIRTIVSDHLKYIRMARQWFTVADLREIRKRKIGGGKVGGKAAGMLLAMRILKRTAPKEISDAFKIPTSYYLGSDVFYNYMALNGLMHWNDQKYKSAEQMRADYPILREEFSKGKFPAEIMDRLEEILNEAGDTPLIVRSSSLLEDNFGTSFAGKYESIFLPNQGTSTEKMLALTNAIAQIYGSVMHPDALLYRHHKELAEYDERIAILIQFVEGERMGQYYLPHAAGVAFSRNLYRWSPQIREDEGFLRLVLGLGTRAVDLVADDCPRLVALSHPRLQPSADIRSARRYSQQNVDVIDLQNNQMKTVPVKEILASDYPPVRYAAQIEQEGYLANMIRQSKEYEKMIINFDGLLARTPFAKQIREALKLLEEHYESPVDTEFTVKVIEDQSQKAQTQITLLQCRPQSHIQNDESAELPSTLKDEDIIFSTHRMVPQGIVQNIRYVLFVTSEGYFSLTSQSERAQLERAIGQLNGALKDEIYIAVGPGRWGTSTPDLGVHVAYSDIFHARSLIELAGEAVGASPEPSFGTHFFQDLMEAKIYPLAVFLDDDNTIFNRDFFYATANRVLDFIEIENARVLNALRLIAVADYRPNHHIDLIMDGNKSKAVAFFVAESIPSTPEPDVILPAPSQLE